ncbi:hypothetical protein BV25DRAFT_1392784 [Artomyces pyxidatus]|uniref:Uncharacterized protein n=1 Tax=Artomyces pyxidatus TaxID=48021 RepID=A0ACB8TDK7_9AGAM|nr:hypothetical protein BV25DRAFT_1392784 [Artomyces pyxidatus]
MAQQQAFGANKGTLVPGQTISVNKYTVQVERYLSQGGFAHVYLVRTAAAVYGTHHHVLKRIAVPDEVMLTEVKKEVDIMRILKGHPNIVHLVDAAWHRMPNGVYEVFILMEFCSGGGIIDMMNRRLRERLTEAEILQIFVDVCEGVAAMHNLRPALLHRDLKVENILQSSETSFKLCDFGSATPVAPRPPSNTQEIRALEADLNRHTTLQYRAPEMVDPYLRRPVDEKSDVWALGVLLYKLCYYTTPFEEHGPLAILNVQYKIPSYPVYSQQINALIASMLREHGAQRPSVFEVLNVVHRMRGTKSRFTYNIPQRQPLSPRHAEFSPLDTLVSYRSSSTPLAPPAQRPVSPEKNAGVQAREKVLEAIAPMRRGRPSALPSTSRPSSPEKENRKGAPQWPETDFETDFAVDEEETWKAVKNAHGAVRGHRSGLASPGVWGGGKSTTTFDDAWDVGRGKDKDKDRRKTFQPGQDAGFSKGFGDSFEGMLGSSSAAAAASAAASSEPPALPRRPSFGIPADTGRRFPQPSRPKDAFDGLGLAPEKTNAPTLGEARKARTGLATVTLDFPGSSTNLGVPGTSPRPPSTYSPRPSPSPRLPSQAPSPVPPQATSWKPSSQPAPPPASISRPPPSPNLSAAERFPSLEELDRSLLSPSSQPPQLPQIQKASPIAPPQEFQSRSNYTGGLKAPVSSNTLLGASLSHGGISGKYGFDGVRSEQVTGSAMRGSRDSQKATPDRDSTASPTKLPRLPSRPMPPRKQRSTASLFTSASPPAESSPPPPPSAAQILGRTEPTDWLTGSDDEGAKPPGTPVLRDSPSKRASVIMRAQGMQSPQDVVTGRHPSPTRVPTPPSPSPKPSAWRTQVSNDTGATRSAQMSKARPNLVDTLVAAPPSKDAAPKNEPLTENWSPVGPSHRRKNTASSASSGDDGPEDPDGFVPAGQRAKVFEFKEKTGQAKRRRSKSKGRQSSVHDLVDLWGGGLSPDKKDREPSRFMTGNGVKEFVKEPEELKPSSLQPPSGLISKTRSTSPQPLVSPSLSAAPGRGPSPTRQPQRYGQSTNGLDATPVSTPMAGRSRPQSMFITSPSTPRPPPQTQVESTPKQSTAALGVPSPDARARRTQRRTSISDMVQRYEAMGGKPIVPAQSTKPVTKVATHGTSTAILSGRVSTGLPVPTRTRSQFGGQGLPDDGGRTSPTGLPRASPVGLPGLATDKRPPTVLSGRRSPFRPEPVVVRPTPSYAQRTPDPEPEVSPAVDDHARTPSPDKPYQGVGRLIDQWQRKTADVEPPRSPTTAKRGSAFGARRAGVVAGRGPQA